MNKLKDGQWWTRQFNPFWGCTPVSPGCRHCYAKSLHGRFYKWPFSEVKTFPDRLDPKSDYFEKVMKGEGETIFVGNMGDIFHPDVPREFIYDVYRAMRNNNQHKFMVLTKRPERMKELQQEPHFLELVTGQDHIELGFTAENQYWLEKRLQHGLIPSYLSLEPLLGPIDLMHISSFHQVNEDIPNDEGVRCLKWVVVGCETGRIVRPCENDWIRLVVRQCKKINIPVYVKAIQKNGQPTSNFEDFPKDLRVRRMPWEVAA